MTQQDFKECIKTKIPKSDFEFDELGLTWQLSYVRLVGSNKKLFDSSEHFFYSVIDSDSKLTSHFFELLVWKPKINSDKWISGIEIKPSNQKEFETDLSYAFKELDDEEMKWDISERINRNNIKIPRKIINCWSIQETKDLRHPVGSTWSKIVETEEDYFYIERHWES